MDGVYYGEFVRAWVLSAECISCQVLFLVLVFFFIFFVFWLLFFIFFFGGVRGWSRPEQ